MLLRSRLFPVAMTHGFTTRNGGVSQGNFASLNMGGRWGDDPRAVAENYRRVAEAGGFEAERLVRVRQVHGDAVVAAGASNPDTEADAVWHLRRDGDGCVLSVLTADCVPVLIADGDATVAAAVHAGWRGTVAGVVTRAVETLLGQGVSPRALRAAIGPCIELDAFEVGDEVAERFDPAFVRRRAGQRPHVDLVAAVQRQLLDVGLAPENVERVGGCTHADPRTFFSYRRDAHGREAKTGQHLSFIGWR